MSQLSFLSIGMGQRQLRAQKALEEIGAVVPWKRLCDLILPYYPTGEGGRPSKPLLLMLKIYFLQQWYNLSDPGMEDAIYDRNSFQQFLGIDLLDAKAVPDETTILSFRHLLEEHKLGEKIFSLINTMLEDKHLLLTKGTIVDATIISAPSSSKKTRERQVGMASTRKGNKYFFGMKAHIGVDAKSGLVHHVTCTPANVNDIQELKSLLHNKEQAVFGDKGYVKKTFKKECRTLGIFHGILDKDERHRKLSGSQEKRNKKLSSVRAKVEHPFRVIKHLWKHEKTKYIGLEKNMNQFFVLFGLSNLYQARRKLGKMA